MARRCDLIGQRFGRLTVIERLEKRENRYQAWLCRCDCGGEIEVNTRRLKSGTVRDCGCVPHRGGLVDLTGRRFGRLQAMEPTERRDRKGSVYWRCVCDCGQEVEVTEDGLMRGNYQSCGCLKRENQQEIVNQLHRIDGTCVEILENRKYRRDNTSGFRGVFKLKNGRYRVNIGFKRKRFYLGTYEDYQEAVDARLKAEEEIHGRFLEAYYQWKQKAEEDPGWGKRNPLKFEVGRKDGELVVLEE